MSNVPDLYNQEEKDGATYADSLIFEDAVVEKIAGLAARDVKGILAMKGSFISGLTENFRSEDVTKGVSAEIDEQNVVIDLKIILEYGASAPDIFAQLKEHTREQLKHMTGLILRELNVYVVDVMSRREYEQQATRE